MNADVIVVCVYAIAKIGHSMKICLEHLLSYTNENVLSRYRSEYSESKISAERAFSELMKYMWLCRKHVAEKNNFPHDESLHFSCVIHYEMKEIDDMWHTFLLFTRDYHEFCRDYLGGVFFHHDPIIANNQTSKQNVEKELNRYLSYIHDNLGEDTLKTWFDL